MDAITLDMARHAKAPAARALGKTTGVGGIGVTHHDGHYALKVNLAQGPKNFGALPRQIEGVPVVYEIIGAVVPRSAAD